MAKVIEYRGRSIEYITHEGTVEDCIQWVNDNCVYIAHNQCYRPKSDDNWLYFIIDDRGMIVPDNYIELLRVKNN